MAMHGMLILSFTGAKNCSKLFDNNVDTDHLRFVFDFFDKTRLKPTINCGIGIDKAIKIHSKDIIALCTVIQCAKCIRSVLLTHLVCTIYADVPLGQRFIHA